MELAIDSVPAVPATASSLAPGFRFHPTDEELVRYYLRRKVCGKPFRFDAISDVEVYKVEPWDLPGLSRLKSRDLEWYFFSVLDKKYGNGSRTNRATDRGYWKTTGKDRAVYHRSQLVGMKKTLVFHSGRAPKGERTNWVMHEYRLIDRELENAGVVQDAFVLCRIFRKSGSGPKNGEQYGAPFVEEEWEDDDLVTVAKQECTEEFPVDYDDDAYLDVNDLEQILGSDMPEKDGPLPLDPSHDDNVNYADVSEEMTNDPQNFLMGVGEEKPQADNNDGPKLFDLPVHNGMDPKSVKHEYIGEPSDTTDFDVDYLLDEPYFDPSSGDFKLDERSFFEADDLKTTVEMDPCLDMFDEYTSFFNPATDNLQYTFYSLENENILPESSHTLENVNELTHQASDASQSINVALSPKQELPDLATGNAEGSQESEPNKQLFEGQNDNVASSSRQEHPDLSSDIAYPFLKKASCMLGGIPAPPAFASEFPPKYLASASQPSSSVRVTTGMIRIRNVSFTGSEVDWSLGKHGQLNIVLSFGLGQTNVGPEDAHQNVKVNSAESRSWFYCLFLWILVLSLSFKIGAVICPRSFMS